MTYQPTGDPVPAEPEVVEAEVVEPEPVEPEAVEPAEAEPELKELEDRWRRAVADADNQRKRFERQMLEVRRAERDRVVGKFLSVLDNLDLALHHAQADPASIVAGVRAVRGQALAVLDSLGYQRLDQAGVTFDPTQHEATEVVATGEVEPGQVVSVLRPGYTDSEGGLLRAATVTVATEPDSESEPDLDDDQGPERERDRDRSRAEGRG
jgi:molecular chaperone GrpE